MIFWIAILQILRLAKLIEAQHFENFKTEGRRGYTEAVLEELLAGALGEEVTGAVITFMADKTEKQVSSHIRGLRNKHCPSIFQHEQDYKVLQEKEEEAKRAASQVPMLSQAINAGIPASGADKTVIVDYLEGFVRDKITVNAWGKECCVSEAFNSEGRAAIGRAGQWKMRLTTLADEQSGLPAPNTQTYQPLNCQLLVRVYDRDNIAVTDG